MEADSEGERADTSFGMGRRAGTVSEGANGVPRRVAAGFGSVSKGWSVCMGCGVRNKNGGSRRWGRKTDSAEGALGRRQACAGQGDQAPAAEVSSLRDL